MPQKRRRDAYYRKRVQKLSVYVLSREAAVRYGEGVVATDATFAKSYRLEGVKRVRPVKRNPLYPERVLYELTFKKRVKRGR